MKRSFIIPILAFFALKANAANIKGYLHQENGPASYFQVSIYNFRDTMKATTDSNGFYSIPLDNFSIGETINVKATDSLEEKIGKTIYVVKGSQNYVPELYVAPSGIPNFTPNVRWIKDTSNINLSLWGFFWKKGSTEKCSALVDSSRIAPHYDWFVNSKEFLEHNDSAYVLFQKIKSDTIFQTLIGFKIDSLYKNAMQILRNGNSGEQSIYFPLKKIPRDSVGIEETIKESSNPKVQNPFINGTVIYYKGKFKVEIYNLSGKKIQEIEAQDEAKIGDKLKSGAYFVKIKNKTIKLIKLK